MIKMREYEAKKLFDEFLDETYNDFNIAGMEYSPAEVLKCVDCIAYREMFLEWADSVGIEIVEDERNNIGGEK